MAGGVADDVIVGATVVAAGEVEGRRVALGNTGRQAPL